MSDMAVFVMNKDQFAIVDLDEHIRDDGNIIHTILLQVDAEERTLFIPTEEITVVDGQVAQIWRPKG